jgi:hypothetical protein
METTELKNRMPIDDFKKIGLFTNDKLSLSKEDLAELSAGRRSGFLELKNLEHDGIQIEQLKAKISLQENPDRSLSVLVHPVYKNPRKHSLLNEKEMDCLINGDNANIVKSYIDEKGKNHKMIIEYDKDTKEFVSMNTNRILIPEKVNNELLSPAQKEKLKEGGPVTISDGTTIQSSPTAEKGIKSNNTFVILSILIDGGMSYLMVTAAKALLGLDKSGEQAKEQSSEFSKGYLEAVKEMEDKKWSNRNSKLINFPDDLHKLDIDELKLSQQNSKNQESRSYTRGGGSR